MSFYGYVAEVYNEADEEIETVHGLIGAEDYQSAILKMHNMYDEKNIEKVTLELWNWDYSTFEVSQETYEAMKIDAKERAY